jgi:hypothetical protein
LIPKYSWEPKDRYRAQGTEKAFSVERSAFRKARRQSMGTHLRNKKRPPSGSLFLLLLYKFRISD